RRRRPVQPDPRVPQHGPDRGRTPHHRMGSRDPGCGACRADGVVGAAAIPGLRSGGHAELSGSLRRAAPVVHCLRGDRRAGCGLRRERAPERFTDRALLSAAEAARSSVGTAGAPAGALAGGAVKRVLITGATGFIGGRLAEVLTDLGIEVTALVRSWATAARLARLPVRMVGGDILDPESG